MTIDELRAESEFAAFVAAGYPRTRATELTIERAVLRAAGSAAVVLVEGLSDLIAVEVVAARCGRNFDHGRIVVVPMGGVTNIFRFVSTFLERGDAITIAGLYDVGAEEHVRRSLEAAGLGQGLVRPRLEALGFYACVVDLEDEFLRALGVAAVEEIVDRQGDLRSLRTMQREPHYRGRDPAHQLHRFIGRWRYRYARLLAEAVDIENLPRPLERLLAHLDSRDGAGH